MKKIAVIVVALFISGCSLKMGVFPLSRVGTPLGIPKQGWEICWDAVNSQMEYVRNQQVPKNPLSVGEMDCLRAGLLSMCGEAINGNEELLQKMYQPNEIRMDPNVFTEYMGKQQDKCEEEGNWSELVKQIIIEAEKNFKAAQLCQ